MSKRNIQRQPTGFGDKQLAMCSSPDGKTECRNRRDLLHIRKNRGGSATFFLKSGLTKIGKLPPEKDLDRAC